MIPKSKQEAVSQAYDKGYNAEKEYHGCSQCLILAVQDVLDMRDDNVFKASSGLGAGVAMMHDTCGALLGAIMILSMKYGRGRDELDNIGKLDRSALEAGKFYKWFEKEFGSTICRNIRTALLGAHYDLKIPWQFDLAMEAGQADKCGEVIGKTAAKTVDLLWGTIEID